MNGLKDLRKANDQPEVTVILDYYFLWLEENFIHHDFLREGPLLYLSTYWPDFALTPQRMKIWHNWEDKTKIEGSIFYMLPSEEAHWKKCVTREEEHFQGWISYKISRRKIRSEFNSLFLR